MVSLVLDTLIRSHLSIEPIRVPVFAKISGVKIDPTSMAVAFAFKAIGVDPVGGDWLTGTWDVSDVYKAQVTPPVLAIGIYVVWLRLTGTDVPIKRVGYLKVV